VHDQIIVLNMAAWALEQMSDFIFVIGKAEGSGKNSEKKTKLRKEQLHTECEKNDGKMHLSIFGEKID